MRFGDDPKPAPYLNRKDQRRLLAMVGVLCLVVFGVSWAARPQSWYWILPPDNETARNAPAQNDAVDPETAKGHFVDLGSIESDSSQQKNSSDKKNNDEKPTKKTVPPDKPVKTEDKSAKSVSSDLPAEWLKVVNDQMIGLRAEEADTYYRVLGHISRLDDRYLKKHARKDVLYVNLLRNPDLYRGKLLRIRGTARRIGEVPVGKNQYGVKKTHEAWILTPDSGSDPIRLVATGIDGRLPTGSKVAVEVEVTGYFLKLYGYASQGGQHLAPLILAARIEPSTVRTSVPSSTGLEPYILAFALFIGLGTIIVTTIYSRGDRKFKQKIKTDFPEMDTPPEQFLEQLKQSEPNENIFS